MYFLGIAFFLLVLSYVYDVWHYRKNKAIWEIIALAILILFAGLKYHLGGDNYSYLHYFYDEYPSLDAYTWKDFGVGKDPLYALLNSFVRDLGGRFYMVQLIHASILNILLFNYIKRHSRYVFTCLFFYFITCFFHYNAEILRASLSIVICLFGNDCIKQNKWLNGYLLYGIALFFHAQTLLMFLLPVLFRMRLDTKGFIVLGLAFVLSYSLQSVLNNYLFLLDNMSDLQNRAQIYIESETYGSGSTSLGGLIVYLTPIIYILASHFIQEQTDKTRALEEIEPFIFLGLLFTVLSYNMPIFYRFTDYYRIYFVILYAYLFVLVSTGGIELFKRHRVRFKGYKLDDEGNKVAVRGYKTWVKKYRVTMKYRGYRMLNSVVCFLPFFIILAISITDKTSYIRYFPYTNVISKQIVAEREYMFNDEGVKETDY